MSSLDAENSAVVLDSLPYIDPVDEDYEQYALALVEDEMKHSAAASNQIPDVNFRTNMMQSEYEKRSEGPLVAPASASLKAPADGSSVPEWEAAVRQARVAYETERVRAMVLQVDKEVAADQWKPYNERLAQQSHLSQQEAARQQQIVEEINLRRQQNQQASGQQLFVLETQHTELLQNHHQLKIALAALEKELESDAA